MKLGIKMTMLQIFIAFKHAAKPLTFPINLIILQNIGATLCLKLEAGTYYSFFSLLIKQTKVKFKRSLQFL